MGDKLKFFVKTVLFLALLGLCLVPVSRVMARKSLEGAWDMTNKVGGFYNEEEDQFEVMFFGPSHAYAAFSPLAPSSSPCGPPIPTLRRRLKSSPPP